MSLDFRMALIPLQVSACTANSALHIYQALLVTSYSYTNPVKNVVGESPRKILHRRNHAHIFNGCTACSLVVNGDFIRSKQINF